MKNAMYLQYEWFSGDIELTDSDINNHILTLKDHAINQQFCDIGVIHEDGKLLEEGYSKLQEWIKASRKIDSNQSIIPVLNYGKRTTSVKFGTPAFNKNLVASVLHLMDNFDIDGIHLDIERFKDHDTQILKILKQLKEGPLSKAHLSISTPATVWSNSFINQIAKIVNQMNPMIYDTMGWGSEVVDESTYQHYFKEKIIFYANAIKNTDCELVPTLPSYELKKSEDGTVYHDPKVESMKAAITALNEAIDNGVKIDGAGIFWGSDYMGLYENVYDGYKEDQEQWKSNWLK